ncbi:dTDP-4-amino-4,6-dideoxyglucose formyltransferase [subsurface metagenome]
MLKIPPKGVINLHPAFLPYNKGANPNVWSIIEGTPSGVSLHFIDEGIDTGPIIEREKVNSDYTDTGKTLYEKLEKASIKLFKQKWESIKNDNFSIIKTKEKGSMHYVKDFHSLDEIDPKKKYYALDLINILRARTFPPYKGSFFKIDGKKYYIEIEITRDNE